MNDEILKLARECGFLCTNPNGVSPALEAFYNSAFNAGLEAAAHVLDENAYNCAPGGAMHNVLTSNSAAIHALEKK